jgi:predicted RNase H-like HicB family nuclease
LPGCTSAGETREQALENIREAIILYLTPDDLELEPGAEILEIAV